MSDFDYTDILINLRKILRSINLESKRIEKSHGVSLPQLLTLNYLYKKNDYQASSSELKNFLNLNASTVSGIISRLEKKNLIARLPKKKDKRVNSVMITSQGAQLLDNIPPLMHEQLSSKLQHLPEDKVEEIKNAVKLLVDIMGIEELDASPIINLNDTMNDK